MKLIFVCEVFICAAVICVSGGTHDISNALIKNANPVATHTVVIGPPAVNSTEIQRRISKNLVDTLTTDSSESTQNRRSSSPPLSPGKVQILEAGSGVRGEARISKKGPTKTRFSNSVFNLRDALKTKGLRSNGGYSTPSLTSFEDAIIPVLAIPGSNLPPPVYSFKGSVTQPGAPAPPIPKPTYGSSGRYKPTTGGGGGGTIVVSTTSATTARPVIIFPPEVVTPEPPRPIGPAPVRPEPPRPIGPPAPPRPVGPPSPPRPIGPPAPVTSVPIIGGGGGSGVLPPSPPEEIFPPAPPPDESDFDAELDVGRRLKIDSDNNQKERARSVVRTRTRIVPSTRVSSKEILPSSKERTSTSALRRDRLRDKGKNFKTTRVEDSPEVEEIIVDDPNVITDFVFSDIKCFKNRQNEYFGATIHMKTGYHLPYIRDRPQDPLVSEECRMEEVEETRGSYHLVVTDLRGCGVEQCGDAMCLTMVFPRVPMLSLADDEVTTIKCTPQKSTISDMKSISFAGDTTENRRSSSTVEGGVQEFVAEVGVFRQNPGAANGLFVKRVNSGGVVQLGESLQLRSVVRGTDGWKHTKLTDVKVWRMRENMSTRLENLDPNQASEVITLVDGHGCRNNEYIVIANEHPIKDPRNDMVHHFTFKAFLFRGQRVNEPLIVTARVHACQETQDCIMQCEKGKRVKRSPVELHNASAIIHDYDSQLTLRVIDMKESPSILDDELPFASQSLNRTKLDMSCNDKMIATGLGGGCIMLLISGLSMALYTYIRQGRIYTKASNSSSSHTYPPPSARMASRMQNNDANSSPYHKPLPPPPTSQPPPPSNAPTDQPQNSTKSDISQVAKLLQELANGNDQKKSNMNRGGKHVKHATEPSEYACIDETNSSSSSSEDIRKSGKKDGLYFVYCYSKDKKNKFMLPMSAPSSMRLRRKHMKQMSEDDDEFVEDEDTEAMASQTDTTEESDDSYGVRNDKSNNMNNVKNQGCRRTVRSVKKKSKQNNNLAHAGIRSGIRRRVSSVYREGYLSGIKGASSRGGSFPLRYKKSPSTGNIPASTVYSNGQPTKKINFSVRETRSGKKRHKHPQLHDVYSSEGLLSESTVLPSSSELDSAYSGSNCSKLTDELYEMKRGDDAGRYPDFRNGHKLQNMMNVQRQLRCGAQGQNQHQYISAKPEPAVRRARSGNTNSTVPVGFDSPPLPLGETKATHFVTRDDSTTKILIVPETHV